MMRKLYFSMGSPYARTIRVLLHELALEFEADCANHVRTQEEISALNPCLAVPVLEDQGRTLFDTKVISNWLLETYQPSSSQDPVFTGCLVRPDHRWDDMQVNAALETLAETMVSLRLHGPDAEAMGVDTSQWPYIQRQHARMDSILDWLDEHFTPTGRAPGRFTYQDIVLIAVCEFSELRGVHPMGGRSSLDSVRSYFSNRPSIKDTVPA